MTLRGAVSSVIARNGAAWTLRSQLVADGANAWTRGAVTASYSTCVARLRGYKPNEIQGNIVVGDAELVADAATLLATPRVGDWVALGEFTEDDGAEWWQVVNVYAPRIAGAVAVYRLQVRK